MRSFVESCLRGEVGPEAIYAFVDSWHEEETPLSLPEYRGMTEDEYDDWLAQPAALAGILAAHGRGYPRTVLREDREGR